MASRKATLEVTTFAPHANGGRTSSFRTPDGFRVTVTSDDEGSNWSARSLAEELAAYCAVEPAAYSDLRDWSREERIEWVSVRLSAGAVTLGARLSVGPYTPAVPAEHLFAVIGRQGQPIMLAHDAFEAARAFVDAEERGPSELEDECYAMETDAQMAARDARAPRRRVGVAACRVQRRAGAGPGACREGSRLMFASSCCSADDVCDRHAKNGPPAPERCPCCGIEETPDFEHDLINKTYCGPCLAADCPEQVAGSPCIAGER